MAGNLLSLDEAARSLRVSPEELKAMHDRGDVVSVRGAAGLTFKRDEINRVADELGITPKSDDDSGFALADESTSDGGSSLSFSLSDESAVSAGSDFNLGSDLNLAAESSLSSDPVKPAPLIEDDDDLLLDAGQASDILSDSGSALGANDDDSLVLEDDHDSVLSSSDSGVNLAPDDSGINLEGGSVVDGSGVLSAEASGLGGSSILDDDSFNFEGGSGVMPASGVEADNDFLLTAGPGGDVDEESSSQVIALDDPAAYAGGDQFGGGFEQPGFEQPGMGGGFGGPALMDQGMDGGYEAAPAAMATPTVVVAGPSEKPYSVFSVLGLLVVLGLMIPAGLLMVDLVAVLRGSEATDKLVSTGLADMLWNSSQSVLESIFG